MKGRYRIIDEHELATLKRKALKVDFYERKNGPISKEILQKALDNIGNNGKTYHQLASSSDANFVSDYSAFSVSNNWNSLSDCRPDEGEEVFIEYPYYTTEYNPEGKYVGTYFDDYIVVADWDEDFGYQSLKIKAEDFSYVKWKKINL